MQTTANYGLKKPEGNDTVDIDVINGNMDSIDGELSKKAPGGYGLGTMAVDISNQDLNNYNTTGFFRGSSMTNAPTSDWYYVEVAGHDEKWTLQIATNYFNNNMYYRRKNNGTWQGWVRIANTADIPSSLPASGGNSTTVGGFSASGTPSTTEKSNIIGMINELFTSADNGKTNIYNAIVGKGTTPASKNFNDLTSGIQNIKTGYGAGDILTDDNLNVTHKVGSEIWSNSDYSNARGIAVDSSGNVYVVYYNYNGSGKTVRKLNSSGTEIWSNSDSSCAYKVAVDASGNVYVVYYNSSGVTVRKFNSSGTVVWSNSDLPNADSVAVDASGNAYVVYYNSSGVTVRKFNSSGAVVWSNSDLPNADSVAVDASGNVYVAYMSVENVKSVRKLNSSGVEIWSNSDVMFGTGIAVDALGNVYVAYSNKSKSVRKFNALGTEIWSNTDTPYARDITTDASGDIYVIYNEDVINKISSSGITLWSSSNVSNTQTVRVDASKDVYIAQNNPKSVLKLYGSNIYTIKS